MILTLIWSGGVLCLSQAISEDDLEVKAHATIYKPSGHWPVGKTQDLQDGRMKILATTKYFGGSLDAHVRKDTEPNGFRISGNFKLHSKPMLAADEP